MKRYVGVLISLSHATVMALPTYAFGQERGGNQGSRVNKPGPLPREYVGPASSGRFSAVAGIPGDRSTYYLGAAAGGVWKTSDSGNTFEPMFDEQPVQTIGALAVAPSDPTIVLAGNGEVWAIRDADIWGDGFYTSTDGGESWTHMGLELRGAFTESSSTPPIQTSSMPVPGVRDRPTTGSGRLSHQGRGSNLGASALR